MNSVIERARKRRNEKLVQLRRHYEIEKKLAARLRSASREERRYLYTALYDELFQQVPNHPQLLQKADSKRRLIAVSRQMLLLKRFLKPDSIFLEVGSGDSSLSREVAKYVKKVYAIDVSAEITKNEVFPQNFRLIISDGCSIPVPQGSISIAYSNNLMEHLHPEDSYDQLQNIYSALKLGGKYICITPNRISGPHDISRFFDDVATGFHLKEYTVEELSRVFAGIGFSKVHTYIGGRGIIVRFPASVIKTCERILCGLPSSLRKKISSTLPIEALLGITVIAKK